MNGPPVALTIAGSDSSAGAGVQADLKTFEARGVYGVNAVTCLVAEVPGKVTALFPADPAIVRAQVALLLRSFPVRAIKTGLLCNAEIARAVFEILRRVPRVPLVVDPVMIATAGDRLLDPAAIAVYRERLFPRATLITPNLAEAALLLGAPIGNLPQMRRAVVELARRFRTAVLLKGGHLRGDRAIDLLHVGGQTHQISARRIRNVATHGTGCVYSAAIAAELAKGAALPDGVRTAKRCVTAAIRKCHRWPRRGLPLQALNPGGLSATC